MIPVPSIRGWSRFYEALVNCRPKGSALWPVRLHCNRKKPPHYFHAILHWLKHSWLLCTGPPLSRFRIFGSVTEQSCIENLSLSVCIADTLIDSLKTQLHKRTKSFLFTAHFSNLITEQPIKHCRRILTSFPKLNTQHSSLHIRAQTPNQDLQPVRPCRSSYQRYSRICQSWFPHKAPHPIAQQNGWAARDIDTALPNLCHSSPDSSASTLEVSTSHRHFFSSASSQRIDRWRSLEAPIAGL